MKIADKSKKEKKVERCKFADIIVYAKIGKGKYANLTDSSIIRTDLFTEQFDADAPFVMTLITNVKKGYYLSSVTLDELMIIAGLKAHVKKTITSGIGDETTKRELISCICAKRIADYEKGKVTRTKDTSNLASFAFIREKFIKDEDGKRTRSEDPILVKEFYAFEY